MQSTNCNNINKRVYARVRESEREIDRQIDRQREREREERARERQREREQQRERERVCEAQEWGCVSDKIVQLNSIQYKSNISHDSDARL